MAAARPHLALEFIELIEGIENDKDRRWYASVLLNRLMFVYFLQRKLLESGEVVVCGRHKWASGSIITRRRRREG